MHDAQESWAHRWTVMSVLTVLAMVALSGCSSQQDLGDTERWQPVSQGSVQVAALLGGMPDWSTMGPRDLDTHISILSCLWHISRYDTATIRDGVLLYVRDAKVGGPDRRDEARLFVLIKYLFDLPETLPEDAPKILKDYIVSPTSQSEPPADFRWPFVVERDGRITLEGTYGFSWRWGYPIMDIFDAYSSHFKRRPVPARNPALDDGRTEEAPPNGD